MARQGDRATFQKYYVLCICALHPPPPISFLPISPIADSLGSPSLCFLSRSGRHLEDADDYPHRARAVPFAVHHLLTRARAPSPLLAIKFSILGIGREG